jgi:hypothetical protein
MEEERFSDSIRRFLRNGVVCFIALLIYGILTQGFGFVSGPHVSHEKTCINNLRLIAGAKQLWASEHSKTGGDVPMWMDLTFYLGRSGDNYSMAYIKCPSGGFYTLGAVSNAPTCSIPGHQLPSR